MSDEHEEEAQGEVQPDALEEWERDMFLSVVNGPGSPGLAIARVWHEGIKTHAIVSVEPGENSTFNVIPLYVHVTKEMFQKLHGPGHGTDVEMETQHPVDVLEP